ncbi:hypothetical protein B0F89_11572 [Malaciobacter marinus]|jgi:hypothetical protein|uniref:Uncharacterized protein n=1 Tax=Malaciobacter marinus TaxID=505249 RepID=A0AB36ZYZ6_9BACT|nr:hypothetical protein B0F89_11572 [Malaciobacter marinus]
MLKLTLYASSLPSSYSGIKINQSSYGNIHDL